jgi:uncharacterized membrane protein
MEIVVLLVLVVVGGWLLGLIGFFRAGRALRELRELRASLAPFAATPMPSPEAAAPLAAEPFPVEPLPAEPELPVSALVRPAPEISPAAPQPAAPDPPAPPPPTRPKLDIEALLTLRWGVWLGAAALLMSGVFLIRYAAEAGLFGPAARCATAALLGLALIVGAGWLLRRSPPPRGPDASADAPPDDPWGRDQAPAGLAAGGIALLFGAAYGAGPFYGLLGPLPAFVLLAAAALAGLAVSLRFGQLVAAIGIAGAFATPLLVQTEAPALPGLFLYLLMVSAAALAVVRHTAWTWLGWATVIAGAAWVCVGAAAGADAEIWAPCLFVPAAAALHLFLLPGAALDHPVGRRLVWVPFAALGGADLLLEAGASGIWPRIGVLLLVPLAIGKGAAETRLDRLPWLAALLFEATLLLWALPEWQPTGEAITIEGAVQAVLPGAWAPQVIQPLLLTALAVAACFACAGLALERRAARPLHWAALPAVVPVVTLAVTYAQVERFQPAIGWAFAALALTAALTATAYAAMRESSPQVDTRQRAGAHAAGAVAALALGCAMLLRQEWLTIAIALVLPPLAWIEARADLPALRRVALAVAALVLIRLLLNWYLLDYAFGEAPVANLLLLTYGLPAACFALAALLFRRRGEDATVAVLQSGAIAFVAVLVALEVRHAAHGGDLVAEASMQEFVWHVATLAAQALALLIVARRSGNAVLQWGWRIEGGLALAGAALLLAANPMFVDGEAWGSAAGLVTLLAGYAWPAALAVIAARVLSADGAAPRRLPGALGLYAIVAGLVFLMLLVRDAFHPGAMALSGEPVTDAELWAWSGAGLADGAAMLAIGIRSGGGGRGTRMAGLAIVALMSAKVFLVDMAGLAGLWRVLSFFGLGLMLIAIGAVYRRFVVPPAPSA